MKTLHSTRGLTSAQGALPTARCRQRCAHACSAWCPKRRASSSRGAPPPTRCGGGEIGDRCCVTQGDTEVPQASSLQGAHPERAVLCAGCVRAARLLMCAGPVLLLCAALVYALYPRHDPAAGAYPAVVYASLDEVLLWYTCMSLKVQQTTEVRPEGSWDSESHICICIGSCGLHVEVGITLHVTW